MDFDKSVEGELSSLEEAKFGGAHRGLLQIQKKKEETGDGRGTTSGTRILSGGRVPGREETGAFVLR